MLNLEIHKDKILKAVSAYKNELVSNLDCQLYRIRTGKRLCRRGLLLRGCRDCNNETLEWLFSSSGGERPKTNCEVYADKIEEAISNASFKGLTPSCAMYMFRTSGEYKFSGSPSEVFESVKCDAKCGACKKESREWMTKTCKEVIE